jgi:hypothetical protein
MHGELQFKILYASHDGHDEIGFLPYVCFSQVRQKRLEKRSLIGSSTPVFSFLR